MAKRHFIERIFNRGLNIFGGRTTLERGQAWTMTNMELLRNSIKRRLGKEAAYQNPTAHVMGPLSPVTALKRFYHLSSGGLAKATFMAYINKMYVTSTDFDDDAAYPRLVSQGAWTEIPAPSFATSPPSLPKAYDGNAYSHTSGNFLNATQSRQWLYVHSDYATGDDGDDATNVPVRTACNVTPGSGTDYNAFSFAHGLFPPQSVDSKDVADHWPLPDSSEWIVDTVKDNTGDDADGVGGSQCVAVDSAGLVHMVFVDLTNADPFHTYKNSDGVWQAPKQIEAVTCNQNFGALSMVIDSNDRVHVAYNDTATNSVRYAYADTTDSWDTWTAEEATANDGTYNSIVITAGGQPGVVYHDVAAGELKYTERTGDQTWEAPAASLDATAANMGLYVVAKTDSTGKIHALYEDQSTNTIIRYITRDAGTVSDGAWNAGADIFSNTSTWGGPLAMDINSDGQPGVVFHDYDSPSSRYVVYGVYDGASWSFPTVGGTTFSTAPAVSMAFDPDDDSNVAHIFYKKVAASEPVYYTNNSPGNFSEMSFSGIDNSTSDRTLMGAYSTQGRIAVGITGGGSVASVPTSAELAYIDTYSYYYRFTAVYDDGKLGESGPSDAVRLIFEAPVSAKNGSTFSMNPTDNRYDMANDATEIRLYRTVESGDSDSLYYRVGSVSLSSGVPSADITDTVSDEDLVGKPILNSDVFRPPKYKTATFWKDRMVIGHLKARDTGATAGTELDLDGGGYHPNRIRFSRAFLPDVFPANFFIDVDSSGESATIRKLIVNRKIDALMVFMESDVVALTEVSAVGEYADAIVSPVIHVPKADGTPAGDSVVSDGEGNIFAWTKTGVQVFEGGNVRYITDNTIKPFWNMLDNSHVLYNRRINMDRLSQVTGVYVPGEEKVLWSYPADTATTNDTILCLDLRRWREGGRREDGWSLYTGWTVGPWMVWDGEGDRGQVFAGEVASTNTRGPWVYRILFGNADETGSGTADTPTVAQIIGVLKTGAFDFGRPDRIRKVRNMVLNVKGDEGDGSDDTSLTVSMDVNDGGGTVTMGTWDPTGAILKHLTSGVPRANAVGTTFSVDITSSDTDSPDPWELYSIGLEIEELPSRTTL